MDKRLAVSICALVMQACSARVENIEQLSETTSGVVMRAHCASGILEVGLRFMDTPLPEYVGGTPIITLPLRSTIRVFDLESDALVYEQTSENMGVAWKSEGQSGHIEYLGFQEVTLPFSFFCRSYKLEVDYKPLPEWYEGHAAGKVATVYVRRARRL